MSLPSSPPSQEKQNVIHRDLAARNVLRVSSEQVKISDFGLARAKVDNSDYYRSKGNSSDLPICWYSPESLATFKFTTKGDVWSYGVTLWEMFTFGDNPASCLGPIIRSFQNPQMTFKNVRRYNLLFYVCCCCCCVILVQ